jgi:hypothetical protein
MSSALTLALMKAPRRHQRKVRRKEEENRKEGKEGKEGEEGEEVLTRPGLLRVRWDLSNDKEE